MISKLDYYKIFNEAAKTSSFSAAAKELFISQSAVSQTITALEGELAVRLFIRHAKGVTLTKEGRLLYEKTSEAIKMLSSIEDELKNLENLTGGELVIGAGDTLCKEFLIPYLVTFRELYPQIHIRIVNGTSLETMTALKDGLLDIAFVNSPINDDTLHVTPCMKVHDIFVSHTYDNHTYTYQEMAGKKLIMLERLSNSRRYVDGCFTQEQVHLKPEMELGAHDLLIAFAENGLGTACVIKEFAKESLSAGRLHQLKLFPALKPRYIGYAHLTRTPLSAAALAFVSLIPQIEAETPAIF